MQIFIHLLWISIGHFIIGITISSWVTKNPTVSPLWAIPVGIFILIPATVWGIILGHWIHSK